MKDDRSKEIKMIWAKARGLRIDRDTLHALNLQLNGIESIAALDSLQRKKLIRDLYSKGQRRRDRSEGIGRARGGRLITIDQQLTIKELLHKLGWIDPKTYRAFCLRVIRKTAPSTFFEAGVILQAFKALIKKDYGLGRNGAWCISTLLVLTLLKLC